jgi:hypothetical protein
MSCPISFQKSPPPAGLGTHNQVASLRWRRLAADV